MRDLSSGIKYGLKRDWVTDRHSNQTVRDCVLQEIQEALTDSLLTTSVSFYTRDKVDFLDREHRTQDNHKSCSF